MHVCCRLDTSRACGMCADHCPFLLPDLRHAGVDPLANTTDDAYSPEQYKAMCYDLVARAGTKMAMVM